MKIKAEKLKTGFKCHAVLNSYKATSKITSTEKEAIESVVVALMSANKIKKFSLKKINGEYEVNWGMQSYS